MQTAPKTLAGFDRITLRPGQTADVRIHVTKRSLSYWSAADKTWQVGTGKRQVMVGGSSRDIRLSASCRVTAN